MKKLLSLILVAALFIGISCIPAARAVSPMYQHSDTAASVLTPEPLEELLGASAIDRVEYSYTLTPVEENPDTMSVTLDFVLYVKGQPYYASATGDIDRYELPSGKVLWEGPTRGTIRVNGIEHFLMAGFAKLDGQEAVQISLTIQPQLDGKQIDPILVSFGKTVFTVEVGNEVQALTKDVTASVSEPAEIQTELPNFAASPLGITLPPKPYDPSDPTDEHPNLGPNGEWKFQEMEITYFKNSVYPINGFALMSQAYFSDTNELAITTSSYCSNVDKYFSSTGLFSPTTSINKFSVSLKRTSNTPSNASFIAGMLYYDFAPSDVGKGGRALRPLFGDLMSIWGVPTSTIGALFDSVTGCLNTTTSEVGYSDFHSATIQFGLFEQANFDSCGLSAPLVFTLIRAKQSGYTQKSGYRATVSLEYRTHLYDIYNQSFSYYYCSANDAIMDLELFIG